MLLQSRAWQPTPVCKCAGTGTRHPRIGGEGDGGTCQARRTTPLTGDIGTFLPIVCLIIRLIFRLIFLLIDRLIFRLIEFPPNFRLI